MNWNWLLRRRRRTDALRFGVVRETADEAGFRTEQVHAYKQPPSLVGPDVNVRPMPMTGGPVNMAAWQARRAGAVRRDLMREIDEIAREEWALHDGYSDGGDTA